MEYPNIHDNFVYAMAVHLEKRILILHTEYRDRQAPCELTDVRFVGLVAHYFEHVVEPSILLDIEEVSAEWVIQQWRELFERGKHYGWPHIQYADLAELSARLAEQGVLGYRVMGSCGLDGFVLAKGVEYQQRPRAAELI
jgi:hypothetical protein